MERLRLGGRLQAAKTPTERSNTVAFGYPSPPTGGCRANRATTTRLVGLVRSPVRITSRYEARRLVNIRTIGPVGRSGACREIKKRSGVVSR